MSTILEQIVTDKKDWVADAKLRMPLSGFQDKVVQSDRNFYDALFAKKSICENAFILECKKSSPSKGLIREDFNPTEIAGIYAKYATVTSVLTDTKYFGGDFCFLETAKGATHTPILCKDFFIDAYQVYLARYKGANAILLMLSVLDDTHYKKLAAIAHDLGMGVLTEVASQEEAHRASALKAKVIGINNRDLHDLSTDLNRTEKLRMHLPNDAFVISESGIYAFSDTVKLRPFCDAYLVGSSLMEQDDIDTACRDLTMGVNKVCGLRKADDGINAYNSGAMFGGLIFVPTSKRCVDIDTARHIIQASPLECVGVFQNASISDVVKTVQALDLNFVQLHGAEDDSYIERLKMQLPDLFVFKAVAIDVSSDEFPEVPLTADGYILDSKVGIVSGGTGVKFNWDIIPPHIKDNSLLSGGIGLNDINRAVGVGCLGLDMNSKLENDMGEKQANLITQAFENIRKKT